MRKKEHSVAVMQQDKAYLRNKLNPVVKPVGLKRYVSGGEYVSAVVNGLHKISEKLEEKKLNEKKNTLLADGVLQNYRDLLVNTNNVEEFDNVANSIDEGMKNYFMASDDGKDFWDKHGANILENNKIDVENIRIAKERDFGRNTLKTMLADNQSLLLRADKTKGDVLLSSGVEEINNTSFLDEKEKEEFRKGYLKTGIYNLALADIDAAREQANKYQSNLGDDVMKSLDEIEKLKIKQEQDYVLKKDRKDFIDKWGKALNLWQQNKRGEITDAEYYVLSKEYDDVLSDNMNDRVGYKFPLSKAYSMVKKINSGEQLDKEEIKNASKFLMHAYNDKKLGVDEVSSLQNKLIYSQEDENIKLGFFDKEIDEFTDQIFMDDVSLNNKEAGDIMEEKARLGLLLNDAYYSKKIALMRSFTNDGGVITPKIDRLLKKQALDEVKEEFGCKENLNGVLSFNQLKPVLKQYYNGNDEKEIWNKFCVLAPFSDNKKETLKKIAMDQQMLELSYPHFSSWSEVVEADLNEGDKFYFKGRLAQKA